MYVPTQEPIAYVDALSDRAAAAVAVAAAPSLRAALAAYTKDESPVRRSLATFMECVWGVEIAGVADTAAAAALMFTPDKHGCTPWLWLSDLYLPVVVRTPGGVGPAVPPPTWFLVQTPDKKRALLHIVNGHIVATLHVKRTCLAAAPPTPAPIPAMVVTIKKKMCIQTPHMSALVVVEVASDISTGSTLPSVPKVNGLAASRDARSGLAKAGWS